MLTLYEHLYALRTAYEKFTGQVCKKYHLKSKEIDILLYLKDFPDKATATDIVKRLNLSKSHVSVSLRALEEAGLVVGEFQGTNRRTIYLRLTESSAEIVKEAEEARELFARTMLEGFTEGEVNALINAFIRVRKNVFAYAKNGG